MKSQLKKFFLISFGLILLMLVYNKFIKKPSQLQLPKSSNNVSSEPKVKRLPLLEYEKLPLIKVGLDYENRAIQKVLVKETNIESEKDLIRLGVKINEENNSFEEFTVFFYLQGMDINGSAYSYYESSNNGINRNYKVLN